ncbi:methyltransferase [Streptomyces sp. JB150]|uniref:methyltransferase n=1 Tax=Streptomyces sp. JB150 TaxID=2714844 RepID=UPI001F104A14|nr:methyltransferase [Streptomyces sp. JB150]
MTAHATLARFREYMVGPARFMNLLSCFELGLIDALRDRPGQSAAQLAAAVGAKPDAVEQLLHLPVKEGFVAHDETAGTYRLDALADVPDADLHRVLAFMDKIKVTTLRQLYYLTDSVRTGTTVGLRELYGFDGDLYAAMGVHADLRESWSRLMDSVTDRIDPWFFDNIDIPAGSHVLDLAGHTGLGAIHTHRHKGSPGLRVTTFDLPGKREECLRNFREHGVEATSSFIGGDVFQGVPEGFDVVLIKHFLNMFDKDDVLKILTRVHASLAPGGRLHILVPIYAEDIKDSWSVDYYPSFFLGCATGQGGPQKLSTFRAWLQEAGFTVTRALSQDPAQLPPDALPLQGILSATRNP